MAIYRIFPDKDTFIFTESATANAGRDEILEIGGYGIATSAYGHTRRTLVRFPLSEIDDVITNKIESQFFTASIGLYLAEGDNIPIDYTIEAYPVAEDWDEGLGKAGDTPINKTGCSWNHNKSSESSEWTVANFPTLTTGSFSTDYPGGGTWYTGSFQLDLFTTQSFSKTSDHDIYINVTEGIRGLYQRRYANNGFILKLADNLEFNTTSSLRLKYFSSDTNTIYPPYLEFKWDDFSYSTGSLQTVTSSEIKVGIKNRKDKYLNEGKNRFRVFVRDQHPTRTFSTSSIYTVNKLLPSSSYWGIRDENTEEMVIDFDNLHTRLNADSTSNYFDVYMNGLQPERYYRLLIKSIIDGTTNVIDDNMVFKVVRNG